MTKQEQLKVFLCHASEDKSEVRELYQQLSAENWMDVWLDSEKLLPGQDWDLEIERAVGKANIVITCISKHSIDKEGYIQRELRAVLSLAEEKPEGTIFVIPLKLEDCLVPRRLQNWQWVDYFPNSERSRAYQRLLESLKYRAKTLEIPTEPSPSEIEAAKILSLVERVSRPLRPEVRLHGFVVMPFGVKKGGDGSLYDFNSIYRLLIKPAMEEAGFETSRVDEETSDDILTDMFQELLLADIVLCDLSIDNANVFYELGIRHAFRKRGVVHIQAGRAYMPFDIFNVRTLPYHITPDGVPDPAFIKNDIQSIARLVKDVWMSGSDTIQSPIYNLLPGLKEPDRKSLQMPFATGFWREYNEWKDRVTVAQRDKRLGDIILLTEEISNPLIMEAAISETGRAFVKLGRYELALAQYRQGLNINSRNLEFRREEAFVLSRGWRQTEAVRKLEGILSDYPDDALAKSYLARIYKEIWLNSWKDISDSEMRLRDAFDASLWLVKAYKIYLSTFLNDPRDYYPGINAMTLSAILVYLAERFDDPDDPDPEFRAVREKMSNLQGTLELILEANSENNNSDYWKLICLAELRLLMSKSLPPVSRAYRRAIAVLQKDLFSLRSSIQQLSMLESLQIRPEFVRVAKEILSEEFSRITGFIEIQTKEKDYKLGNQVVLFTGYTINNLNKKHLYFPPEQEDEFRNAIYDILIRWKQKQDFVAITAGLSAGCEILFVECCIELNIPVSIYLPLSEVPYIRNFVAPYGEVWVERFYKARSHPLVSDYYQVESVGEPKEYDNVYERNNRWALYSAIANGIDNVRLLAVWDGKSEVAADLDVHLVQHMINLMRDTGGIVEQINPWKLKRQD